MTERRLHLIQGECRVTSDPQVIMTTTLGSCVAACVRDPEAGVGGMNHFLLPESDETEGPVSLRYGAWAMELLVNGLLRAGARRHRLEAKLFGGGRLSDGLSDIGGRNAAFARDFLAREGIRYVGGSTGGAHARKIQYWPVSGRARQMVLARADTILFHPDARRELREHDGSVELF